MLAPEVWDFPPPKVMCSYKEKQTYDEVIRALNLNNFYESVIIAIPDEPRVPVFIEEIISGDTDYYRIWNCPLTEFIQSVFIESFVQHGSLHCISSERNCVVQNCFAVTPDGILILHVFDFIYRSLGLDGVKQNNNYYRINIDLKSIKREKYVKLFESLSKIEPFDFYVSWEPTNPEICPSSVAKYFHDRNIKVTLESMQVKTFLSTVPSIPWIEDLDIEELVEWVGLLAHKAPINTKEGYISRYVHPEGENSLSSTNMAILIGKGFLSPKIICSLCDMVKKHTEFRQLDKYWASISIQSYDNSLWCWDTSHAKMFQPHNASTNIFFTHNNISVYSAGQINYT
ncbi:uncharacterized protein LOC115441168 [Manduca sexta]|uniref:uncharacterized protein LOC115441168 n=1 Tax=Manduca sexta TaxID=7130 RepID=UPI0011833338|nr:uncharacterized protein LOC115441168 [Manduca sexta]